MGAAGPCFLPGPRCAEGPMSRAPGGRLGGRAGPAHARASAPAPPDSWVRGRPGRHLAVPQKAPLHPLLAALTITRLKAGKGFHYDYTE